MNRLRLFALAATALLLAAFAAPMTAETFGPEDRAAVQARIDHLDGMMRAGDLAGAIDVVPPRLLQAIADRAGLPKDQLRALMREQISGMLENITVVSFDMDLDAAPPLTTPDGSRTYLLVPMDLVLKVEGVGKMRARGHTLALEDEGQWYLIRVEDAPQIAFVRELWPEFAEVEFPAGTTEAVD